MLATDNTNGNNEIGRPSGRRVMLLAGVNDAPSEPNLSALSFAESSTKDLSDMLQTAQCGFELYVPPLLGHNATTHAIRTALLDAVEDLGPNDLLVFYFCGHGLPVKIKADELDVYLISYDFKERHLKRDENAHISMRWLQRHVLRSANIGRVVLLLDCCYSGWIGEKAPDPYFGELVNRLRYYLGIESVDESASYAKARWSLTASSPTGKAFESNGRSVFAAALLRALNGIKVDDNGYVTINILESYIAEETAMYQTCTRFGFGPNTQADRIWLAYYPQFAKAIIEEQRHQEAQRSIEQARRDGLLQAINEEKLDPDYFDERSTQRYSFDHTLCKAANEEDLERMLLDKFFEQPRVQQRRAQSAETFSEWQNSKLWRNHYPTHGALLCFGRYPQRWLPGARTHCIRWEGNEQDTILDRQDLEGSLLAQYERIFNFLQAHLRIVRNRSRQKDADQWEIPFPALREAIANALIHRDYPKRDDGIYIELFDDRLEITNPGVFPVGTSAETFINTGTQGRYTNPFIADVFYLSGYVEQVGSGLRKMKKEMEQAGLQPPEFLENKDSRKIKVILSRPKLPITSFEPLPAFQVPYPPNPLFLGRNAELQQLSSALLGEGSKIAAVLPAIAGIGGIGKTQLASEFAHRYRNDFPGGVFWLNMAQPETVAAQVAAAGGPGGLDLPGWSELDFEAKIVAVRRAWNEPVRRLIVFDDLDDPRLLQQWRPTGGGARVLITTRRGAWTSTSGVQPVVLQSLMRVESMRLLLGPRHGHDVEIALADPAIATEADAICAEVGDLPLALALAGAYLEQTPNLSLAGYRARLAEQLISHPSLEAGLEENLPTQHAESIAATIALSYQQINATKPSDALALGLLQRMAQLASAPIPQRLLVRLIGGDPSNTDQITEIESTLRRLAVAGLAELIPDNGITLHRLIAVFVRSQDHDVAESARQAADGLIKEAYSINQAGYPLRGQPYLVHMMHFTASEVQINAHQLGLLNNELGTLLQAQGDLARARPYYERALAIYEQALGADHPDTATSLNNLAALLQAQGDLAGARPYYERALAIYEQALGADHPDTATSLNNLAALLQAQGDLAGAQPYYERALAIREQLLGPNHPDTARSLNNLGYLLRSQGDLVGAQQYYERALTIYEHTLGAQHPDTALSLNNLGALLQAQGDLTGARPYLERALAISEKALGSDHPTTATSLSNLGALLQAQGDLTGARPYLERALAISEKALGSDHPTTATSLSNLGQLVQAQGNLIEAQKYVERAIGIYQKILGTDHAATARSVSNLGLLLYEQGDFSNARRYLEQALEVRERVLGADHPDTAASLNNLALLLVEVGEYATARPLYERSLEIVERVLGADHPDTATSLNNLALLLVEVGEYATARPLYERSLEIVERVLGPEHPTTATSLTNLGLLFQKQGNLTEGQHYLERALGIHERVFGTEHPTTVANRQQLNVLYRLQQRHAAKDRLMELVDQLAEALNDLPGPLEVDAEAANEMARQVRDYTTRENPNKTMVQISTSGLRLAIQKLAADIPKADDISLRIVEYAEKLIS